MLSGKFNLNVWLVKVKRINLINDISYMILKDG